MDSNSYLSFEKYQSLKASNDLSKLALHKEHIHQSCIRYALIDNLVESFDWQYWLVITYGYNPHKSDAEKILELTHYRFDRWIMTNNKRESLSIDERSRWVCLPEKGSDGHLHHNCFLNLKCFPNAKTYGDEWNAIRVALKQCFKSIQKEFKGANIDFRLYERKKRKDALKQAVYSTKEMRSRWMNDNHNEDHFANYIRSWADWQVKPMNKRSPKKITIQPKPSVTLEQFFTKD